MSEPAFEVITQDGEVVEFVGGVPVMGGQLTRVAWAPPEDLSFDQWSAFGHTLQSIEHSVMWWIGDWLRFGERKYGETYAQAIEVTAYSYSQLANAKYVAGAYEPSVRTENVPWAHHLVAAALPPIDRAEVLHLAEMNGWSVREVKAEVSRRKTLASLPSALGDTCKVADLYALIASGRKFGAIYADPPWRYDNQGTRAATGNHYRSVEVDGVELQPASGMSVEELCDLPIGELCEPDAHLHLWTTNGFLFECPRIFEAWGFEFRSSLVWVKPQMGIGNYWRNSHEFLLTAIRGDAKRFNDKSLKSWLECARGAHSSKPEQVRGFIEKASHGPYLELFGRRTAPGWVVWGNDITRTLFDADVAEIAA